MIVDESAHYQEQIIIMYMKKFLHSGWLRAVQLFFFFFNSAEKS